MFDRVFKLLLLLTPLAYTNGISLNVYDQGIFPLSVMTLFLSALWSKPQRNVDYKPLALLLALCGWNFSINKFNPYIYEFLMTLFFGILAVILISIYCKNPRSCFKFIMWAGILNILVFIGQKVGFEPIVSNPNGEPGGIFGNGPRMCMYLALTLPFVLETNFWIGLIYIGIGIFCTEYIILALGIFIWLINLLKFQGKEGYREANFLPAIFIIICSILVIFFLRNSIIQSINIRWLAWKPIIEQIFKRPYLGFGLGMFPRIASQFLDLTSGRYSQANHCLSSILYFIFGVGLLGVAWLIYIIQFVIKRFKFNAPSFAIISLLILSTVEYPFEVPKLWFTICAIIGFFLIENKLIEEIQ